MKSTRKIISRLDVLDELLVFVEIIRTRKILLFAFNLAVHSVASDVPPTPLDPTEP